MKFLLPILLFFSLVGYNQQDPHLTTEGFSPFWTNPASYGIKNNFGSHLVGRKQWQSVQGDPGVFMTNSEAHLNLSRNGYGKFSMGTGLMYMYDQFEFQKSQKLKIPINFISRIGEFDLGVGVGLGVISTEFTPTWIPPQTVIDSSLAVSAKGSGFDMDLGLFLNHENFYVGLSTTHLLTPNLGQLNFSVARHYYLQAGYQFKMDKISIYPMLDIKADGAGFFVGGLSYFQFYDDAFSLMLGYHLRSSLSLGATARLKKFKLAYIFQLYTTKLTNAALTGHELRLSFSLPKKANGYLLK